MATPTYKALATVTLTATASSVTFSGFPTDGTYRDLVLVVDVPSSAEFVYLKPNGLTTDLSQIRAFGDGSSGSSSTRTDWRDVTSGTSHRTLIYQLLDYSATDKHKTVLFRQSVPSLIVGMAAMRWASTTAISSLVIERLTGSLPVGAVLSLYGIEA